MDLIVWALAGLVFLGVESVSLSFVMVYFALGSFAAVAAGALGAPVWGEVLVFASVSLTLLLFTRRLIVDLVQTRSIEPTNVHTLIGRGAVVTIPVSSDLATGQIRVGGEFWTARPFDEREPAIPAGARVEVVDVTGVTARVRRRVDRELTGG